jgi:succinate dehydrogenase flavin-adding protein (antitoxin of CptAB toxin-antitoxin module)
MARYRSKDETDLRWNRIRRRITRELDIQIMDFREKALNDLLTAAWEKYAAALSVGDTIELEGNYERWVDQALTEAVTLRPVADDEVQ